jgi:hypothetical protein
MLKPMCATMAAASLLALSFGSSAEVASTGGGGGGGSSSSGPVCDGVASTGVIWPPDHSMVAETIIGVTDDPAVQVTIQITGIQQDEPVLTQGSGNTQPDGVIQGSTAYVRAERAGPGTGRLYFISYTATDTVGYSCTGTVQVQVPHDQGQGITPIDTNNRYDSTMVTTD